MARLLLAFWLLSAYVRAGGPVCLFLFVGRVKSNGAVIHWMSRNLEVRPSLLYTAMNGTNNEMIRVDLPNATGFPSNYTVEDLDPGVHYQAVITVVAAIAEDHQASNSNVVSFTTTQDPYAGLSLNWKNQVVDVILALAIISAWVVSLWAFWHQWGGIHMRGSKPYSGYLEQPKNIENIKIVKRATDSIIYKNVGRQTSMNMERIDRRAAALRRMGTSPAGLTIVSGPPVCPPSSILRRKSTPGFPLIEAPTVLSPLMEVVVIIDEDSSHGDEGALGRALPSGKGFEELGHSA